MGVLSFKRACPAHWLRQLVGRHRHSGPTRRRGDLGDQRRGRRNDEVLGASSCLHSTSAIRIGEVTSTRGPRCRARSPVRLTRDGWRSTSSRQDPWMPHSGPWLHPTIRIPSEAFADKVDEQLVVAFQHLRERLGVWSASFSFSIDKRPRGTSSVYKISIEDVAVIKTYRRRACAWMIC